MPNGTSFSSALEHAPVLRALAAARLFRMSQRPELLIRRLGRRFGVVLAVVAGLLLADQAVLQPLLVRLNLSAPVINLAGRQRMLSQSIAKDALALSITSPAGPEQVESLERRLAGWERVHQGLKDGDPSLGLTAVRNPTIRQRLLGLDAAVTEFARVVKQLNADVPIPPDDLERLLAAEQAYLPAMDQVVRLFEQDAQHQVERLRTTALVATGVVIVLMAGLYWLVLAPAVALIRQQVERLEIHERELEQRVGERTRELSQSNLALEREAQQRAESEQRTLQLQAQLAQASRLNSLGELATGIAHELNQPLGAISNYAETMLILADRSPVDGPSLAQKAARIREAAQRAGAIIRGMRNFIRSRHSPRTPESVNSLIVDVVSLCEPDLRGHWVAIQVEADATRDAVALVDPIQIQQVLVNLIRNASQAVECRPAGQRRIMITTRQAEGCIEVNVLDNGEGFPKSFDVAAVSLQSTKPDGLGLGLSISRTILETHGGKLLTSNDPEGGARVTVLLPVHQAALPLEPADRLYC